LENPLHYVIRLHLCIDYSIGQKIVWHKLFLMNSMRFFERCTLQIFAQGSFDVCEVVKSIGKASLYESGLAHIERIEFVTDNFMGLTKPLI